ncbi:MAG: hypothetical protein E7Z72_02790 [Methanocorpusculum parvum]|nr:hypothetical protein [Methanocorpusculum parvum]
MDSFVIFEDTPSSGVWKAMIIKAIIFVVLGIFCLAFPFAALNLSAYLLAFFLLIISIAVIFSGFSAFGFFKRNWLLVILGIIGIGLAIYSFISPAFMMSFAAILIGLMAIIAGIADIVLAFGHDVSLGMRILTILLGLVEGAVGIIFLLNPGLGAQVLVLVLGIGLIISAVLSAGEAYVVKKEFSSDFN